MQYDEPQNRDGTVSQSNGLTRKNYFQPRISPGAVGRRGTNDDPFLRTVEARRAFAQQSVRVDGEACEQCSPRCTNTTHWVTFKDMTPRQCVRWYEDEADKLRYPSRELHDDLMRAARKIASTDGFEDTERERIDALLRHHEVLDVDLIARDLCRAVVSNSDDPRLKWSAKRTTARINIKTAVPHRNDGKVTNTRRREFREILASVAAEYGIDIGMGKEAIALTPAT